MQFDASNRMYYCDASVIIADSSRLGIPVLFLRKEDVSETHIKEVLKTCKMRQIDDTPEEHEGNKYLKLKEVTNDH